MIDKVLDLCLDESSGLPDDIKELLREGKFDKVSTIVQEKTQLYGVYKMRAVYWEDKGVRNIYGFKDLLHNMEISDFEKISLTCFLWEGRALLVFCSEDISVLIGSIWSEPTQTST